MQRPGSARLRRAGSSINLDDKTFQTIFNMSDNDKDGCLNLVEFKKALAQLPALNGAKMDESEYKLMFLDSVLEGSGGTLDEAEIIEQIEDGTALMTLEQWMTVMSESGAEEEGKAGPTGYRTMTQAEQDEFFDE